MKVLDETKLSVINAVATDFYKVIPAEFRTFCAVTSMIAKSVLKHFGIDSKLLPCQVWLMNSTGQFVVGFTQHFHLTSKWNGHVVCAAENFIIDTALHHFVRDFGLEAPSVAVARKAEISSQVISIVNVNDNERLLWCQPPNGFDLAVPREPSELISSHARQLVEFLEDSVAGITPTVRNVGKQHMNTRHETFQ